MYLGFQNTTRTFPTFRSPCLMFLDFHFLVFILCFFCFVLAIEMYISWKKTGAEAGKLSKNSKIAPSIFEYFWIFFSHNRNQEFELLKYSGVFAV